MWNSKGHANRKLARANRDILCEERVKADCIRDAVLSNPNVYRWWTFENTGIFASFSMLFVV